MTDGNPETSDSNPIAKSEASFDIDKFVGSRVRLAREQCGMTIEELAKAVGITVEQAKFIEEGKVRLGDRLTDVAEMFSKDPSFFLLP